MIRSQPRPFQETAFKTALPPVAFAFSFTMTLIHCATLSDQDFCCIPKLTRIPETRAKAQNPYHKAVRYACVNTPRSLRQLANHSEKCAGCQQPIQIPILMHNYFLDKGKSKYDGNEPHGNIPT